MNRDLLNRFSFNPTNIEIPRSKFSMTTEHKTTFNAGKLIPLFVHEVLPGDTFNVREKFVCRMSTPIHPVMDNAFIDTYYFFVPNRLVWDHWQEMMGENNSTFWEQPVEYETPHVRHREPAGRWGFKSVADYMGVPPDIDGLSVNALPFRAYVKIWNDWFRDQNVMTPANLDTGDSGGLIDFGVDDPVLTAQYGVGLLPVSKYHDYFTSCLPEPQKGAASEVALNTLIPIATEGNGNAPIMFSDNSNDLWYLSINNEGNVVASEINSAPIVGGPSSGYLKVNEASGLTAELGSKLFSINELRQAFQIQRLLEKDARGGTRYIELIKSHFGVTSPDARLQRSEYLGGNRVPISMSQVVQMSATDEVSPQGNVAAYSLTGNNSNVFIKSFVEHGFVIGVAAIRTYHTYQQGLERMWSRKGRFDYYWPSLAHISEQPVLNKEIYMTGGGSDVNDQVFGYQEAWAEYRYKPSRVSSAFRSSYPQSLDVWHYADYFDRLPTLSKEFISETDKNIDRTLAVSSELEDQFIFDGAWVLELTRPMPMYSIPGLIDHM